MYLLDNEGEMLPYRADNHNDFGNGGDQELGAMPASFLSSHRDYVGRARYLVGTQAREADSSPGPLSGIDTRRAIAKLERATTELRQGILSKYTPFRTTSRTYTFHRRR